MLKDIITAFQSYLKAHRFIKANRLWKWIILPGLLYTILFVVCMYLFGKTATNVVDHFSELIRERVQRVNLGWVNFLVSIAGLLLWILLMFFYFSLFKYIFLIIGSPLFAWLSEKTESIMEHREFPFNFRQLLKDMLRGIRMAVRNSLWQTVYTVAILLLSFIPLIGWATPVLSLFIECYYYGFSMLDYSCERHQLSAPASIRFIGNHKGLAIGNGFVFYLMHFLPVVGWILAPSYAVVAATISLYHPKEQF